MFRLLSLGIILFWIGAMSALFMRDVYPAWTAQDAPVMTREQFAQLLQKDQQLGIFDGQGRRRGTAWSDFTPSAGTNAIHGTVLLEGIRLLPVLLVETTTEFDQAGELDNFTLEVFGVPMTTIKVHGERHGLYFPCEIQAGPLYRQANLEMAATRLLGNSFQPFGYLPTLKVGQSWRMQVIDPVSAVMGGGTRFMPLIATVSHKESILHGGKPVECFVVATSPGQAKAWVGPDGRVYKQEVNVPGFGLLVVLDEDYRLDLRSAARDQVRYRRNSDDDSKPSTRPGKLPTAEQIPEFLRNAYKRVTHGRGN